jgi:hypothetical protein
MSFTVDEKIIVKPIFKKYGGRVRTDAFFCPGKSQPAVLVQYGKPWGIF